MIKFTHTADLHYQNNYNLPEIKKCFQNFINMTKKEKAEFAIIAGDLFHGSLYCNSEAYITLGKQLEELSKDIPTLAIYGNHDKKNSLNLYGNFIPNLHIISENQLVYFTDNFYIYDEKNPPKNPKVFLFCIPYPEVKENMPADKIDEILKDFLEEKNKLLKNYPNIPKIIVAHLSVQNYKTEENKIDKAYHVTLKTLQSIQPNYVALGHIHMAQELDKNIWYSSAPWSTNIGETSSKFFNLVEIITDFQTKVTQVPSGHLKRWRKQITIKEEKDIKELSKFYNQYKNGTSSLVVLDVFLKPGILHGLKLIENLPFLTININNIESITDNVEIVSTISKATNVWDKFLAFTDAKKEDIKDKDLSIIKNRFDEIEKEINETDEI